MTTQEFLAGMEDFLQGEVPSQVIRSNLQYYQSYIREEMGKGRSEQEIMEELGDPRLIARSIIDAADAAEGTPDESREAHYGYDDTSRGQYRETDESAGTRYGYEDGGETRSPRIILPGGITLTGFKATLAIAGAVVVLVGVLSLVFRAMLRVLLTPAFWVILVLWMVWRTFLRR